MLRHRQAVVKQGNPTSEQSLARLLQATGRERATVHIAQNGVIWLIAAKCGIYTSLRWT